MTQVRPAIPFVAASLLVAGLLVVSANTPAVNAAEPESTAGRLVGALLANTPLTDDLRSLTREIGGRATGSDTNLRAVEWGLERFRQAGVEVRREPFEMPELWLERSASATIHGENIHFDAAAAAMPFSTAAPTPGVTAPLLDAGIGSVADFERLGALAKEAFLLVETPPLLDVPGLFREYNDAYAIEGRAVEVGARGVVYMSSRAEGILYRHNSSLRGDDARPMLILERGAAIRALDLLRQGSELSLTAILDLEIGPAYESYNVIGEIRGSSKPQEVVLIGAHLDSWDLGGGALDNGANVSLVIDIARQMQRLGIRPARTIRFALWNGEEQGLVGSYRYTETRESELDDHVVAMSFDIGCGRINGFFTGGRPEILATLEKALAPVAGLGPFQQIDIPVVGTDNFDFMMHGVANLIGNQESATYGPNYHAQSDRIDQCDLRTVRLNAAIVAAVTYGFATADVSWGRQSRDEIEALIRSTDLEQQMRSFNVWEDWEAGRRGRRERPGN